MIQLSNTLLNVRLDGVNEHLCHVEINQFAEIIRYLQEKTVMGKGYQPKLAPYIS